MFKPFSTKGIRVLSSVTRYTAEKMRPLMLTLAIDIVVTLCIGYWPVPIRLKARQKSIAKY